MKRRELIKHGSTQLHRSAKRERVLADVLLARPDDGPAGDHEHEWAEVAKRRDRELSEGRVQCRSHEDVIASARETLADIRA